MVRRGGSPLALSDSSRLWWVVASSDSSRSCGSPLASSGSLRSWWPWWFAVKRVAFFELGAGGPGSNLGSVLPLYVAFCFSYWTVIYILQNYKGGNIQPTDHPERKLALTRLNLKANATPYVVDISLFGFPNISCLALTRFCFLLCSSSKDIHGRASGKRLDIG
ncbi:Concanavalin A-like lectin/glucanase, subgroup [Sesbania bispinosa]|nr:Concanavalin A-like lectin/glucanase, subgroup [Sesbania bispinosa]